MREGNTGEGCSETLITLFLFHGVQGVSVAPLKSHSSNQGKCFQEFSIFTITFHIF